MMQQAEDGSYVIPGGDYMEQEDEWEREGLLDPAWEKQQKKVSKVSRTATASLATIGEISPSENTSPESHLSVTPTCFHCFRLLKTTLNTRYLTFEPVKMYL